MRHRDLLMLREQREFQAAEERAEKERIEAPIRAAEEQMRQTANALAEVYRERLLGKIKDTERIPIDASVATIRMTKEQAREFNLSEFRKFREENPEVYFDHELLTNFGAYFERNGLALITAGMIGALIDRYREYGLLPNEPQADPVTEPTPEPEPIERPKPEVYEGWDPVTGEPRSFSKREVDRMGADEYRRVFRIYRDALVLPNVGPGGRRNFQ